MKTKTGITTKITILLTGALLLVANAKDTPAADALKVHGIFSSHMVIQRDKPIAIWGWTKPGDKVSVTFGTKTAEANAAGKTGR
jgi:sialate O-acetylesterase